jgi:hypothetical protein
MSLGMTRTSELWHEAATDVRDGVSAVGESGRPHPAGTLECRQAQVSLLIGR